MSIDVQLDGEIAGDDVRPGFDAQREQLLDEVALTDVDLDAAEARLDALVSSRRRARRAGVAALLALLVVGVGALVGLAGGTDPDELVADRDRARRPSTTSTSTTLTIPAAEPPPVALSIPTTTLAPAPSTAAPTIIPAAPSIAPAPETTTTAPPTNQELVAEVSLTDATVAAGATTTLEVGWIDPDHAGGEPELVVDAGDPVLLPESAAAAAAACDSPGGGDGGTIRRDLRFVTPGRHEVRVELRTCGGQGRFGERIELSTTVDVGVPKLNGQPARAIAVFLANRTMAQDLPGPLDAAQARLVPAGGGAPVQLPTRTPVLAQNTVGGATTVLVVPARAEGALELRWPGSPCVLSGPLAPPLPSDNPYLVRLPDLRC